jgi:hypothetical protein
MQSLPPEITAWLTLCAGPHRCLETIQDHDRSSVWRVEIDGQVRIVKRIKTTDRWHRELHAYRAWSRALAPYVPELLDSCGDCRCLLLTALNGRPMKHREFRDLPKLVEAYRSAGRLARRFRDAAAGSFFGDPDLDGKPLGESWSDPVAFISSKFMSAYDRAMKDAALDSRAAKAARWARENLNAFAGEPCVPVNPDYDTGNWLADEDGQFCGVIDFEYARWGLEYETFVPLWTRDYARLCEQCEEIFMSAYGASNDDGAARRRRVGLINQALQGIVWSLDHNPAGLKYDCEWLGSL